MPGSVIHADEASHWDSLHARYLTKRINHSVCYSDGQASTNMAESFFSRLRRSEIGIHHHFAGPYLSAYADEMAWRDSFQTGRLRWVRHLFGAFYLVCNALSAV